MDEPLILIQKKSAAWDLLPVLEQVAKLGKPLIIIAEESKAKRWRHGGQQAARHPQRVGGEGRSFGDRRKAMLEDIAITGSQVISGTSAKLGNVKVDGSQPRQTRHDRQG